MYTFIGASPHPARKYTQLHVGYLSRGGGATLDFVVQGTSLTATSGGRASTPRVDCVHATPEPSILVLLTAGLIGLLCYAWRKRRSRQSFRKTPGPGLFTGRNQVL